ncbi:MAG: hypothetical protein KC561_14680 [Myxococcales bacterium]|nr:hypothetical protein [Myxococcales bacterium]
MTAKRSFLAALLLTFVSCFPEAPPELPPVSTLQPQLAKLAEGPAEAREGSPATTQTNYALAWSHVAWLYDLSSSYLRLPAEVVAQTEGVEPIERDGGWAWDVDLNAIQATLTSSGGPSTYEMAMVVVDSFTGMSNQTWMTGTFDGGLDYGQWLLYGSETQPEAEAAALVQIDWTFYSETELAIQIEDLRAESDTAGHIAVITVVDGAVRVEHHDQSGLLAVVEWNAESGEGVVEETFQPVRCWSQSFANTACSAEYYF